ETTGQVSHTGTSDYPHYRGHSQGNGASKGWGKITTPGKGAHFVLELQKQWAANVKLCEFMTLSCHFLGHF
ncbi:hypothetical protein QP419_10945, partial [Corynebacterium amycolatum]|uniref:hypothetical protein n=1 Tax=Corynebacterium amycolatum TaxID=43765 RepID=UPI00254FAE6B